jgi:hypothetical protein
MAIIQHRLGQEAYWQLSIVLPIQQYIQSQMILSDSSTVFEITESCNRA